MLAARSETGQSLIWTTMLLAFVILPLLVLVVDGIQLWRIRNQLQTATDAACEEAAWVAADRQTFRDSGVTTLHNLGRAKSDALASFHRVLSNTDAFQYSPGVVIVFNASVPSARCSSAAAVTLLISSILPAVTIEVESESQIRFSR